MVRARPGSSSSTQVRSTDANNSASPWARTKPRGPAAPMSAAVSIHCCERSRQPLQGEGEAGIAHGRAHQRAHGGFMRGKQLDPAHQHVEQPLARRLLGHVGIFAGEHRAVDPLYVGGQNRKGRTECAAQVGERNAGALARSRPSRSASIGFSASSAMKASMMRSRSDRSSLAGARRVTGFALDLRAMTELRDNSSCHQCRRAISPVPGPRRGVIPPGRASAWWPRRWPWSSAARGRPVPSARRARRRWCRRVK